jgi:hypothetical protein
MSREKETLARIKIQKELKFAANLLKLSENSIETKLATKFGDKKVSKTKLVKLSTSCFDDYTRGRLLTKEDLSEPAKTSKYRLIRWLFLDRDHKTPFEHFEVKNFELSEILYHTRIPDDFVYRSTGIFVTRHCLERVALRLEGANLSSALNTIAPYISAMTISGNRCAKKVNNNKLILLTEDAYVVVLHKPETDFDDETFLIQTFLPRKNWSKRREFILKKWADKIKEYNENDSIGYQIMLINPSAINDHESPELNEDDIDFILGSRPQSLNYIK